jgi:hypothetical protein
VFEHRPGRDLNGTPAREEPRQAAAMPPASANPDFRQRFGSYAGHAQAELATYQDLDEDDAGDVSEPANSNTAPGNGSEADRVPADNAEPADIVVPFPAARTTPGTRPMQALTERLTAALAALGENIGAEPTIGVELRREPATLRVPVSKALLPEGLIEFAQAAPGHDGQNHAPPQLELTLPAPDVVVSEAPQPHDVEEYSDADEDAEAAQFEPPLVLRRMAD